MLRLILLSFVGLLALPAPAIAADDNSANDICSLIQQKAKLTDPSRRPTAREKLAIKHSEEVLSDDGNRRESVSVVDADNDGIADGFAWNTEGTARNVLGTLYRFPSSKASANQAMSRIDELDIGILADPQFVRSAGVNYIISSDTGDDEGRVVLRFSRNSQGKVERKTVCRAKVSVRVADVCPAAACKALARHIADPAHARSFLDIEWPHKYFPPAGLSAFFEPQLAVGDFDNSGLTTTIWRIGRKDYYYQNVYWQLLAQGGSEPHVDPALRPDSESRLNRMVAPGPEHARLRHALARQSKVISAALNKAVFVPGEGQFFLFADQGKTYWVWDFEDGAMGETLHLVVTTPKASTYVGAVKTKREVQLRPCERDCFAAMPLR